MNLITRGSGSSQSLIVRGLGGAAAPASVTVQIVLRSIMLTLSSGLSSVRETWNGVMKITTVANLESQQSNTESANSGMSVSEQESSVITPNKELKS